MSDRLDDIATRAAAATAGPWRWVGNTDSHNIHLENPRWVVLGTQRIDRTAADRDVQQALDYLWDCGGGEHLTDEELTDLGIDLDDEKAVEAAQGAHLLARAIEMHLQEDEYGQVRYDERLAMRTSGDDSTGRLIPLEQQARYHVCPEAESREDPRVYRADYTPRSPDAAFIAHARADIDWLIDQVTRLRALVGPLAIDLHRMAREEAIELDSWPNAKALVDSVLPSRVDA